ncbi:uncharacterized protein LOC114747357 [Neltuma alba]|uniref:uncharacterized protein LOC114747357 n=1 Tax=Neltuma alba TaxID=207710 RepID=UPI0010A45F26|nr:uncharacterized protein LOC114747357 [Prosopis alba]
MTLVQSKTIGGSFFVTIYWLLWKRRNEKVFENTEAEVTTIVYKIKAIIGSFNSAATNLNGISMGGQTQRPKEPIYALPEGWVEIFVDGAYSITNNKVGSGGLIKAGDRNMVEAFMLNVLNSDPLGSELWACIMGFRCAWDGGYRKVRLRSDSLEALELIKARGSDIHIH